MKPAVSFCPYLYLSGSFVTLRIAPITASLKCYSTKCVTLH